MKVLIVKTSSMGDVIHTLPALTDAGRAIPGITFDWVVEENFVDIPSWHPLVESVIPVAWRRWRKNLFSKKTAQEFFDFCKIVRAKKYDLIIDAQGLLKSAVLTRIAQGRSVGWSLQSARDPFASLFYKKRYMTAKRTEQHAVTRLRDLFSKALGYALPSSMADYGVDRHYFEANTDTSYLVFLHGTTWNAKHWPESYWIQLAEMASDAGYHVKVAWGNEAEVQRAMRIRDASSAVAVLPRKSITEMAAVLAHAKAIVAVDTGLCHLAAALDVPTVSLYGPTDPTLSGAVGKSQVHLRVDFPCSPCLSRECTYPGRETMSPQPPCFGTLPPEKVWAAVLKLL